MRVLATLTAFCLLVVAAQADEPLVWKWAEGDSTRYLMTQTMRMTMDAGPAGQVTSEMRQDMVMNWRCVGLTDEGNYQIEQATERIVMSNKTSMGQGFSYDTAADGNPEGMATLVAPVFDAMVENPFTVVMKPSGEFLDVILSDPLARALDNLPGGGTSADMVVQMAKQSSLQFPDHPLAVGDSWTNEASVESPQTGQMKVLTTFVYNGSTELEGTTYEAFTPAVSIESLGGPQGMEVSIETKESTGEVLFDREAGRAFRTQVLQAMDVGVTFGGQQISNLVNQGVELRQLAEGETPMIDHAADSADATEANTSDRLPDSSNP